MSRRQQVFEWIIQALIAYSLITQFIEIEFTDTHRSVGFFLWSERAVAALFTFEYLFRWRASRKWSYPLTPLAIIDMLAVLPFYVGFFVDLRALRLIRTLRVLRLFKFYRHSLALQNMVNAFVHIRYEFSLVGFAVLILGWGSAVAIFEFEREAQPDVFGGLSDALWFVLVTLTTVGYGDKVPATAGGKVVAALTMLAGLGLFGTFVSLLGSAFIEELRRAREVGASTNGAPPFDARAALARLERDVSGAEPLGADEVRHLLGAACAAILRGTPAKGGLAGAPSHVAEPPANSAEVWEARRT